MNTTNTIRITTDGPNPLREIHITVVSDSPGQREGSDSSFAREEVFIEVDHGDASADDTELPQDTEEDLTTAIGNVRITTHGPKPPADIQVTVTCDVTNTRGHTPRAFFPAQATGIPMTHVKGNTWTVSNTQMYSRGEKTLTIMCNGVKAEQKFKA